ncbi:DUF3710 domain-containing protein [Lysinibacter cavernae]|uniref:DUF3710 domain-containing protein n=1 Tax=Lysinibacter cavernae TaxID=1640652 RepID=A0A7X5QZ38_9MICO|nr:DUF3710 domain-containing protein [Lysinibacter cavernae]NIH52665.1 hypothetical protein [Lysinibacter cavernae]
MSDAGKKSNKNAAEVESVEIDVTEADEATSDAVEQVELAADENIVDESKSAPDDREENGPFDVTEASTVRPYVDLGAIKVLPREGMQMRLDVEEATQRIIAVSLDYADSSLQVQAFSAPRSTGMWHEVRGQLEGQLDAQKAKYVSAEGPFGPELQAKLPAEGGKTNSVRFIGVDGPRWFLRGVISGKAASDEATAEQIHELFRSMVVVRGDQALPPRDLLPLRLPAAAVAVGEPEQI